MKSFWDVNLEIKTNCLSEPRDWSWRGNVILQRELVSAEFSEN